MAGSLDRWDRLARSLKTEIDQRLIAACHGTVFLLAPCLSSPNSLQDRSTRPNHLTWNDCPNGSNPETSWLLSLARTCSKCFDRIGRVQSLSTVQAHLRTNRYRCEVDAAAQQLFDFLLDRCSATYRTLTEGFHPSASSRANRSIVWDRDGR